MTNSAKTPSGKAKKGQVTVRPNSGSVKACFPRNYFADGKQVKLGTGINPDDWEATASKLQRILQLELEDGKLATNEGIFNLGRYQEILEEYRLRAKLRLVRDAIATSDDQVPPKPDLSLMEIWDMCGHKPDVSNKHYQDEAIFMKGINPEIPFSQQQFGLQIIDNQQSKIDNQKSEIELLREQNKQLRKLLEEMKNKD